MTSLNSILDWLANGYGATLIILAGVIPIILGLVAFFDLGRKLFEFWHSLKSFSWKQVDKCSKIVIKQIERDKFVPDMVVGIGRGGAIVGSILSGNIIIPSIKERNIPALFFDRHYDWQNGERVEVVNNMVDFTLLEGKKVLLVAADVITGGTMKFYVHQLRSAKVSDLKTACLVKSQTATFQPNYFGQEVTADCKMPWMYKGYSRDSRSPCKDKKA